MHTSFIHLFVCFFPGLQAQVSAIFDPPAKHNPAAEQGLGNPKP